MKMWSISVNEIIMLFSNQVGVGYMKEIDLKSNLRSQTTYTLINIGLFKIYYVIKSNIMSFSIVAKILIICSFI